MKTTVCAVTAAVALGVFPLVAQAADDLPSVRVSFADLDLNKAAGRTTLERRIDTAVRRLCGPSPVNVVAMQSYRGCRRAAWSGARVQLAAIYDHQRYAAGGRIVRATSD